MKQRRDLVGAAAMAAIVLVMLSRDAFGYLDPGTTSYLYSLLIAGLAGMIYAIKVFWSRITFTVMRIFGRKPKSPGEDENNA